MPYRCRRCPAVQAAHRSRRPHRRRPPRPRPLGGRGLAAVLGWGAALIIRKQVSEQALSGRGVPAVSRRGPGGCDDLRVGVDRDVSLVAVETAGGGLVPMPRLRVDGGDHPVLGDPPGDPEHPPRPAPGPGRPRWPTAPQPAPAPAQLPPVECRQQRTRVAGQRVDQRLARRRVVVITGRLARGGIVVVAAQQAPQLRRQLAIAGPQQPADRRANQRHRVQRGHRVIQRRRVQHPPPPDQPRRPRHLQRHLEDPVRPRRPGQPRPHIHQHRVHEPRVIEVQPAGRILPAHIEPNRSTASRSGSPRAAAAPSPPPRSAAAPSAGPHRRTDPQTSRPGTARSTPGATPRRSSRRHPTLAERRRGPNRSACLGARPSVIGHSQEREKPAATAILPK